MCFAIIVQTETEKITIKVVGSIVEAVAFAKDITNAVVEPIIPRAFIGIEEEI